MSPADIHSSIQSSRPGHREELVLILVALIHDQEQQNILLQIRVSSRNLRVSVCDFLPDSLFLGSFVVLRETEGRKAGKRKRREIPLLVVVVVAP